MAKPEKFIDERQKIIDRSLQRLDKVIPDIEERVYKIIAAKIGELDLDPEGNIRATSANLKIINSLIKRDVRATLLGDDYENAVLDFIKEFGPLGEITRKYFNELEDDGGEGG